MPRFFFNLRNDLDADDPDGVEFGDIAAARECALESAREIVCADIMKGFVNLDHRIEVVDESGRVVFTITFREAFDIKGQYFEKQ